MRAPAPCLLLASLLVAVPHVARADAASVCAAHADASTASQAAKNSAKPDWVLDHYVRSASQEREWAVMVDCNHPGAPEQIRLVPGWHGTRAAKLPAQSVSALRPAQPTVIRAGTPVVVVNVPGAAVTMNLTGVAVNSAQVGQMIRVRLDAFHSLVSGIVRGPETVELVAAVQTQWGQL